MCNTELEVLWQKPVRDVGRAIDEGIVDDLAGDVDGAEAADAAAAFADVLGEFDSFAVESEGGAGSHEVELGSELLGAAGVLFDAARVGGGLGVLGG